MTADASRAASCSKGSFRAQRRSVRLQPSRECPWGAWADRSTLPLTLNHVTLYASSVARSKAFYQRLTGLPIQAEDKDFCEFRLESGFLGIYAADGGQQPGFNHFCSASTRTIHRLPSPPSRRRCPGRDRCWKTRIRCTYRTLTVCAFNLRTCATSVNANRWAPNHRLQPVASLTRRSRRG